MPKVSNINNLTNIDNKKSFRKLSFESGEVFNARVIDIDKDRDEAILKFKDGWKFSAQIENQSEIDINDYSKFIVQGFEDGKLKLKVIPEEDKKDTINSEKNLESILKEYSTDYSEESMDILKTLLKHYIPLTKDNVLLLKAILDFKKSVSSESDKNEELISKFLKSKKIDENSDLGKSIKETLKNYINELKDFDMDEIATFIENGIELTGENINSFKNIVYKDSLIFDVLFNIVGNNDLPEESENMQQLDSEILNEIITGKEVSSKINSKIDFMKNILKGLIKENNEVSDVMNAIKENINNFKVFNDISKQYYYVDVPIKFNSNEYNCKLIIKDDRKTGKKIDSTNVKIVASVNTINLGTVDIFISVADRKIDIDLKVEEKFSKDLNVAKEYISNKISKMGFIVKFEVKEKKKDEGINLVSCRSFFNTNVKGKLDVIV